MSKVMGKVAQFSRPKMAQLFAAVDNPFAYYPP